MGRPEALSLVLIIFLVTFTPPSYSQNTLEHLPTENKSNLKRILRFFGIGGTLDGGQQVNPQFHQFNPCPIPMTTTPAPVGPICPYPFPGQFQPLVGQPIGPSQMGNPYQPGAYPQVGPPLTPNQPGYVAPPPIDPNQPGNPNYIGPPYTPNQPNYPHSLRPPNPNDPNPQTPGSGDKDDEPVFIRNPNPNGKPEFIPNPKYNHGPEPPFLPNPVPGAEPPFIVNPHVNLGPVPPFIPNPDLKGQYPFVLNPKFNVGPVPAFIRDKNGQIVPNPEYKKTGPEPTFIPNLQPDGTLGQPPFVRNPNTPGTDKEQPFIPNPILNGKSPFVPNPSFNKEPSRVFIPNPPGKGPPYSLNPTLPQRPQTPNGANPNGNYPNGYNPNGNPNGPFPNGNNPNGHNPNGNPNGHSPNGNPNGHSPNGNPNGPFPNGNNPNGSPNGHNPDGSPNEHHPQGNSPDNNHPNDIPHRLHPDEANKPHTPPEDEPVFIRNPKGQPPFIVNPKYNLGPDPPFFPNPVPGAEPPFINNPKYNLGPVPPFVPNPALKNQPPYVLNPNVMKGPNPPFVRNSDGLPIPNPNLPQGPDSPFIPNILPGGILGQPPFVTNPAYSGPPVEKPFLPNPVLNGQPPFVPNPSFNQEPHKVFKPNPSGQPPYIVAPPRGPVATPFSYKPNPAPQPPSEDLPNGAHKPRPNNDQPVNADPSHKPHKGQGPDHVDTVDPIKTPNKPTIVHPTDPIPPNIPVAVNPEKPLDPNKPVVVNPLTPTDPKAHDTSNPNQPIPVLPIDPHKNPSNPHGSVNPNVPVNVNPNQLPKNPNGPGQPNQPGNPLNPHDPSQSQGPNNGNKPPGPVLPGHGTFIPLPPPNHPDISPGQAFPGPFADPATHGNPLSRPLPCSLLRPFTPNGYSPVSVNSTQYATLCPFLNPGMRNEPACSTLDSLEILGAKKFRDLIINAGLKQLFEQTDGYTVFAPLDIAFNRLPNWLITTLQTDQKLRQAFVLNHFVKIDVPISHMENEDLVPNSRPGKNWIRINVYHPDTEYPIYSADGARLLRGDILSAKGRIHLTDKVIMPNPPRNAAEYLSEKAEFEDFWNMVKNLDLYILQSDRPITVFIPVNGGCPGISKNILLGDHEKLKHYRDYHIVNRTIYSTGMISSEYVTTNYEKEIKLGVTSDGFSRQLSTINGNIKFLKTDIPLVNGVAHVIDRCISEKVPFYGFEDSDEFEMEFGVISRRSMKVYGEEKELVF